MNLAEKRILAEFQKDQYPALVSKIKNYTDAPIEVDWDSLCIPEESHLFLECWSPVYFEPLADALETVGRDELGREALKGAFKSIVIQNKKDCANSSAWAHLENGVLTLDHRPTTNIGETNDRKKSLVTLLEKSL